MKLFPSIVIDIMAIRLVLFLLLIFNSANAQRLDINVNFYEVERGFSSRLIITNNTEKKIKIKYNSLTKFIYNDTLRYLKDGGYNYAFSKCVKNTFIKGLFKINPRFLIAKPGDSCDCMINYFGSENGKMMTDKIRFVPEIKNKGYVDDKIIKIEYNK